MGGSGGGGGSGQVGYPAYMEAYHTLILDDVGTTLPTHCLQDMMNEAYDNSPFTGVVAYDPDADIASMIAGVTDLDTLVALLSAGTGLDALVAGILSDARVDAAVTEYSADLGDRLTVEVLPRFEAGMRDINAVTSSAFAIGRAMFEVAQVRQVAKYSADLHLKSFSDDALRVIALKLEYQKFLSHYQIESNRIKIVAKKEEAAVNMSLDEADATWNLELFQHAGNLLASAGGGTAPTKGKVKDQQASAIGGAVTGAVIGTEISPGYGTIIGAVLGAAAGYFGA